MGWRWCRSQSRRCSFLGRQSSSPLLHRPRQRRCCCLHHHRPRRGPPPPPPPPNVLAAPFPPWPADPGLPLVPPPPPAPVFSGPSSALRPGSAAAAPDIRHEGIGHPPPFWRASPPRPPRGVGPPGPRPSPTAARGDDQPGAQGVVARARDRAGAQIGGAAAAASAAGGGSWARPAAAVATAVEPAGAGTDPRSARAAGAANLDEQELARYHREIALDAVTKRRPRHLCPLPVVDPMPPLQRSQQRGSSRRRREP